MLAVYEICAEGCKDPSFDVDSHHSGEDKVERGSASLPLNITVGDQQKKRQSGLIIPQVPATDDLAFVSHTVGKEISLNICFYSWEVQDFKHQRCYIMIRLIVRIVVVCLGPNSYALGSQCLFHTALHDLFY